MSMLTVIGLGLLALAGCLVLTLAGVAVWFQRWRKPSH